jgi:hypothetical protein
MNRFAFAALLAAPLFGCVSGYQAPVAGALARIDFVNDTPVKARVLLYDDAAECRKQSIFDRGLAPGANHTATVAADKDLAFGVDRTNGDQFCMSTRSFRPQAGKTYTIHFRDAEGGCTVLGMEGQRSVTLAARQWIRPLTESGSFCTPLR